MNGGAASSAALKVVHCPGEVGGQPGTLARAEREIGLHSTAVSFSPSRFAYESDEVLWDRDDNVLAREWKRWRFLGRTLWSADVIHFNFGASIAPQIEYGDVSVGSPRARLAHWYRQLTWLRDLPLLRRAGKVIAVTYQGSDARQWDRWREIPGDRLTEEVMTEAFGPASDEPKRKAIATFDRHADLVYALSPDLLRVLPERAAFLPVAAVDHRRYEPAYPRGAGRPVVLHAPSDRAVKGTRFLLEALDRLRGEGLDFELVLLEGLSHAEAQRQYHRADLVVDQLLVGWYGGFAIEAMALGKPVFSYLREEEIDRLEPGMARDLPVVRVEPDTVTDVLRDWLTVRRGDWERQGRASRAFVERYHDPQLIANRLRADYEKVLSSR